MVLIWGGRCLYMNAKNLEWQNTIRTAFREDLASMGISPLAVNGLVMLANDNEVQEAVEAIEKRTHTSGYHLKMSLDTWAAIPHYAGFKTLWYRTAAVEKFKELDFKENGLSFSTSGTYSFALYKGYLFIRLNTPKQTGKASFILQNNVH